jgi:hypothetical protein
MCKGFLGFRSTVSPFSADFSRAFSSAEEIVSYNNLGSFLSPLTWGGMMLLAIGLALGLIVVFCAIRYEVRSALYGISLSNGVEVLVNEETYGSIVRRFQTETETDDVARWDHAVLDTLRPVRPQEWNFLVRSLRYRVAPAGFAGRRSRRRLAIKR